MASAGGDSSGEECGLQIDVGKADGGQTKARGRGTKVTKAVEVTWNPGDIVWAKVSGFNYWPAKIFDPSDSSSVPKWLSEPPKPNYVLVRFFGSYDMQWVSHRLIEGYEKGFKKKFQSKSRSKLFQKSVKEVREYVENGITPEGLTQSVHDPDAQSSSEGEGEGEKEGHEGEEANDTTAVADIGKDQPPSADKETKSKKVVKVKEAESSAKVQHGVTQSSSSSSNGSRSRRRKGSPRKLSSSSADNEETNPAKKAKLDTVEERGKAVGDGKAKGEEEIQAFTSAPLPLTANSEKLPASEVAKLAEPTKTTT